MKIFKPIIEDLATFSGSVDISGSLTITQNLNVVGELQGAATTASYVSLANVDGFAEVSSSIEQRISGNEGSVNSLNQATASYALEANISGAFTEVSESFASTISGLSSDFADITNKPTLISSSNQLAGETIDGDLTITGTMTAQEFHTEFVSASIIYQSGSTKFGNSADDRHEFTGSVFVSNGITGTLTGNASTATSASYAASGPFLSSYTETDTLASVTGRGASTSVDISIANGQPKLRLKETDSTDVDKELLVSGGDFYIRNLNDNDTAGTNLLSVDSSGHLSATGRGQFAGAIRITETGTAQHILIGNQNSSGTNAPGMIRGVNAALQFGVGDSWTGEGGNMTVRMELKNDGNAYFTNSLGIGTTSPKDILDIKGGGVAGGIAFGTKSMSISQNFANALTVSLGNHTGVYVKITAFGDWSNHSTTAYVGEFFLQNGAGSYMEPGSIIREDSNIYEFSQDNDNVVAQIVDPIGTTGDRDFTIQLKASRSNGSTPSGVPFTAYIQYEVRGQYKSIS